MELEENDVNLNDENPTDIFSKKICESDEDSMKKIEEDDSSNTEAEENNGQSVLTTASCAELLKGSASQNV